MKVTQYLYHAAGGWHTQPDLTHSHLVFVFGERKILEEGLILEEIRGVCPHQHIVGCSTAGEINGVEVHDGSVVVTALQFNQISAETAVVKLSEFPESREAGVAVAQSIPHKGLKHVIVFSDGLHINGSKFVRAVASNLPSDVTVTGGLAGDGPNFSQTCVV
ncbi:MAG: hypothetical protein KDD62_12175, partial [Bdellovibrionales bacterium]|nr:hypothetical protein [Bdellovibrionales bacterium]